MNRLLSIVIVNYNSGNLLGRCVDSLERDELASASQVIVVDNSSSDDSLQAILHRPGVRVIHMDENRGFGAANNIGIAACSTPFVLMINPDTELLTPTIRDFLESAFAEPGVGLAGCRVIDPRGALQKTARRFPTVSREAAESIFVHRLVRRPWSWAAETLHDDEFYSLQRPVDWVSGAVMFARTDALRQVGGFDEGFFLFAEEIDLCKRLKTAGWSVVYDPSLTVVHVGGVYTTDPNLAAENQRSKLRYFLKHEGRLKMVGFAAVVVMRLSVRSALWKIAGSLRNDDLLRSRSRAALSTLIALPGLVFTSARTPRPSSSIGHLHS